MRIKIATWNMAYCIRKKKCEESWKFLIDALSPDIALVQESKPPADIQNLVWREIGGTRDWGSGVIAKKLSIKEIESPGEFQNSYPGALTGARVSLPNGKILNVFSLYGLIEYDPYNKEKWYTTRLHRMLSDLTFLLLHLHRKKQHVIIGGDFNAGIQFDKEYPKSYFNQNKIFFERLADYGLTDCFSKFYSEPVQTLRFPKSRIPWQNDRIYVSNNLISQLQSCQVIDNESVRAFSDHNPVLIELEL